MYAELLVDAPALIDSLRAMLLYTTGFYDEMCAETYKNRNQKESEACNKSATISDLGSKRQTAVLKALCFSSENLRVANVNVGLAMMLSNAAKNDTCSVPTNYK